MDRGKGTPRLERKGIESRTDWHSSVGVAASKVVLGESTEIPEALF